MQNERDRFIKQQISDRKQRSVENKEVSSEERERNIQIDQPKRSNYVQNM